MAGFDTFTSMTAEDSVIERHQRPHPACCVRGAFARPAPASDNQVTCCGGPAAARCVCALGGTATGPTGTFPLAN